MTSRSFIYRLRISFALTVLLAGMVAMGGCANLPPGYPYRIESKYAVDDPQFAQTVGHLLGPPLVEGNQVETLVNGDQIFPAMLEAICAAQKSITFETFIYWKGETGRNFTEALSERASAGVKVHLLIDAVGSDKMDQGYISRMKQAGCEVEVYHPLRWFDLTSAARLNHRTHRKLLIVDGMVGFTGGVGIADEWNGHAQDKDHWRDSHYRITGPAVAGLQCAFCDHWIESNGGVLHGDIYFPPLVKTGELRAQVFKSGPDGGGESMQVLYLLSFAASRKHLRLGSGYFVPDDLTVQTLLEARRRGVRVQILIPGATTDIPITRDASRATWGPMLKEGIEIYEYQTTMYHCKVMVVDGLWVSVGSANLNNRGFRLNGEANLNVLNAEFAAEQARVFDEDLKRAHQVTYEEWKNRPFGERLKEGAASLLKWQL